jgi:hypothetical protein
MIPSRLFYFSLLSAAWMSFVRAVLTPDQEDKMRVFLEYTGGDLFAAFDAVDKRTLDTYFFECVGHFHTNLCPFLRNLDYAVRSRHNQAPPADQQFRDGFTKFVNLIKYSNLTILNELKWNLFSTYGISVDPESILGMINDEYVVSVWNEYATYRATLEERPNPLETYTVHIAILYSMNRALICLIPPNYPLPGLKQRLENYQHSIIWLHYSLARYVQILCMRSYSQKFVNFDNQLKQLIFGAGILDRTTQIRNFARNLSNEVLAVIVIYGCPAGPRTPSPSTPRDPALPGREILDKLFENHWDILRLIGHQINPHISYEDWMREVLRTFAGELRTIQLRFEAWDHVYAPCSLWVSTLLRIVNTALDFLDRAVGQGSGTN